MWVPLAGYRPDHRAGVELAAIDPHRATEAAADLERRLDDGVARQARRDRFEIGDFAGRAIPFLLVLSGAVIVNSMWDETVRPASVCHSGPPHIFAMPRLPLTVARRLRTRVLYVIIRFIQ